MKLSPSACQKGVFGIAGHAGIGHAYSHSGFFQEDSGGFAILLTLLRRACPMDITIKSVEVLNGEEVVVTTAGGGSGRAVAMHGFTPYEADLMQRAVGMSCAAPQSVASRVYGRVYGQGTGAQGSAFALAVAKALADTVRVNWPEKVLVETENIPDCCGEFVGGVLDMDGTPVSWMLTINAAIGGTGPIEDAEGCVPVGNKKIIMDALGMTDMPLIVLESKAYAPAMQPPVPEATLYVRWNEDIDNPVVGQCLAEAAKASPAMPALVHDHAYPRNDSMLKNTVALGDEIIRIGEAYRAATTSQKKCALMAELFNLCSHDAGGTIFMTDGVFRQVGGGGLWPGLGAMLAMTISKEEADREKALCYTDKELDDQVEVVLHASRLLKDRVDEAMRYVRERRPSVSSEELWAMATAEAEKK